MKDLKITQFDTLKIDTNTDKEEDKYSSYSTYKSDEKDNLEVSTDKFIKKLEKEVNHSYLTKEGEIEYGAKVLKLGDNYYSVQFTNCEYYFCKVLKEYGIHTDGFPHLTGTFDKLSEVTKRNMFEKESHAKMGNGDLCTSVENASCLNYLNKLNKHVTKHILKSISPLFGFITMVSAMAIIVNIAVSLPFHIIIIAIVFSTIFPTINWCLDELYMGSGLINNISLNRVTRRKIRQLKRKLRKGNINVNTDTVNVAMDKESLYRDSIIAYMDNIMKAAKRLKKDDEKSKLIELREILDDYTSRCQALNHSNDDAGLRLDGGKRQIMQSTLDKLTTLEMEIADMLNRDSKNSILFAENDKFKQELDKNIMEAGTTEEVMTSDSKVLIRKNY